MGEQGLQYSSGAFSIVERLPDEMITVFDPNVVGHRMRYQSPAINDSGFVKTKTYSTTWEAQGLAGLRKGAVWYRYHFKLPANLKGKPIGLFLGGFEDEARVWINGKVVGTSGVETSGKAAGAFAVYDLTDGIKYGGDNLVAIQVVRHGEDNTNRVGGIIRPSFLLSGPHLPRKAAQPLELRRVLPGGELGQIEE
jgi:beta-galactosidase